MDVLLGLVFSFLWASASTAAKYSFQGQPPLTILSVRFAVAGAMMMTWHYGLRRDGALPRGQQWGQLAIIGLTNSTLFLGAAWLGLREVPVGYTACSSPLCPSRWRSSRGCGWAGG